MTIPTSLLTERLRLRCWRADDAAPLRLALLANAAHLTPWIPARIATPAELPALRERLAGFVADFATDREWRFAVLDREDDALLGEVSLHPRDGRARVPWRDADRVEIGYWLRQDVTGRGIAVEAVGAIAALAARLPGVTCLEIRCDERNIASARLPQRLGFRLQATVPALGVQPADGEIALQLWTQALLPADAAG